MNLTPVESSNIAGVHYDPSTGTLTVQFHSGARYAYYDVSPKLVAELMEAKSKGSYFSSAIKPYHPVKKLGGS